jgi:hypothetical protein
MPTITQTVSNESIGQTTTKVFQQIQVTFQLAC